MAKTKTRDERIEEKVKSGMSRVKAEIEVKREDMLAKLDALEEQERAQEARLDQKVLALLKEDEPDVYDRLHRRAEEVLDKDREVRSRRSRASVKQSAAKPDAEPAPSFVNSFGG